jgi:hypothetical protein
MNMKAQIVSEMVPDTSESTTGLTRRNVHITTDEPLEDYQLVFCYSIHTHNPYHPDNYINPVRRWLGGNCELCKKIVASTDPTIRVPTISKEWIRDVYNPSDGTIVEVELLTEPKYDIETLAFTRHGLVFDDNGSVCIISPNTPETVDQAATQYTNSEEKQFFALTPILTVVKNAFKAGAEWQKQQTK